MAFELLLTLRLQYWTVISYCFSFFQGYITLSEFYCANSCCLSLFYFSLTPFTWEFFIVAALSNRLLFLRWFAGFLVILKPFWTIGAFFTFLSLVFSPFLTISWFMPTFAFYLFISSSGQIVLWPLLKLDSTHLRKDLTMNLNPIYYHTTTCQICTL